MCRAVWRDRISFPLRSIRSDCLSPDLMWEYGINVAEWSEDREALGGADHEEEINEIYRRRSGGGTDDGSAYRLRRCRRQGDVCI